ncbi:unnamed protein product [Psylliodes chrysocephalus]|uniref:Transcription factor n=1 Tax=Psylliodes chrysocephalus TaxID=3402493 RepID=A0A9P0CXX3_9CUCU|nr:unnamed protein product [Psylliodes chrysocephala]
MKANILQNITLSNDDSDIEVTDGSFSKVLPIGTTRCIIISGNNTSEVKPSSSGVLRSTQRRRREEEEQEQEEDIHETSTLDETFCEERDLVLEKKTTEEYLIKLQKFISESKEKYPNMSKVLFTVTEDELLVELVAKHPALFDLAHSLYKDQVVKENAWKEIAEALSRSVYDCKKRWKNIKDTYNRRKKRGKTTGSSALPKHAKWALSDMLSFLDQTEHKRPSTSLGTDQHEEDFMSEEDTENNIESGEVSQESSRSGSSTSVLTADINPTLNKGAGAIKKQFSKSSSNRKEKINEDIIATIRERSAERNEIFKKIGLNKPDSLDLFFQSIAASVKALRPELINEAKLRTMHLIFELEERNASIPQPNAFELSPGPATPSAPNSGNIPTIYNSPSSDNYLLDLDNFQSNNSNF